jgi:four helix bundle protein
MTTGRMRVREAAELLAAEVDRLLPRARGRAPRQADHLERAAESVLFNTAEGNASFNPNVKASAYDIARREAAEARAVLHRLVRKGVLTQQEVQKSNNLASVCMMMLTKAIKAQDRRSD